MISYVAETKVITSVLGVPVAQGFFPNFSPSRSDVLIRHSSNIFGLTCYCIISNYVSYSYMSKFLLFVRIRTHQDQSECLVLSPLAISLVNY